MTRRILTVLVALPVLIAAVWFGFPYLPILVAAAAAIGLAEYYRLSPGLRSPVLLAIGGLWTLSFVAAGQLADPWYDFAPHFVLGAGLLLALPTLALNRSPRFWALAVIGPIYVGFLLAHGLMLRELDGQSDLGRDWLLFTLIIIFANDTGAYVIGRAAGKTPMAPVISPKKTWEGSIGGFLSAVGVALVLGTILELEVPIWQSGLIGVAIGILSQAGDLAESRLKRAANVKDTGTLLPGHGGVLDRMDSIVLAIPVVYYLVAFALRPAS